MRGETEVDEELGDSVVCPHGEPVWHACESCLVAEVERLREEQRSRRENFDELVLQHARLSACREELSTGLHEALEQRDALADALESCDWSYGRVQSDEVHAKIAAALRKAGR